LSQTLKAKIIKSSKRIFECKLESAEVVSATALGKIFKTQKPVVGDWVEIQKTQQDEYEILSIIERKNEIYRQLVREKKKKVIAANIDLICIVMSVSKPEFKRGLLDRYLLRSVQWEIPTVVIFNKMDEFEDQIDIEFESKRIKDLIIDSFEISSTDKSYQKKFLSKGLDELKEMFNQKTAILMGQSGVGKSKLISAISGGEIELISGKLAKVGKGAHTTTWAEIVSFDNFDLVDSPGVRTLSINDISIDDLNRLFPDIFPYFQHCKFNDCRHEENSKGCFFNSLDENDIDNQIALSRLDSYLRFKDEIEEIPEWQR
jgi:ribosome biogenesis GTPase